MSNVGPAGRSFAPIVPADLQQLQQIAARDRQAFFDKHPAWADLYQDRLLCVALCQGAALHYLTGEVGVNDFDVYGFFAQHPDKSWPARRHAIYDFGDAKFGRSLDRPDDVGRRVDVFGRSIDAQAGADPVAVLHGYLQHGLTATARLLAQKAVVLLDPLARLGEVIWPEENCHNGSRTMYERLLAMSGENCYTLTTDAAAEMCGDEEKITIRYVSGNSLEIPRRMVREALDRLVGQGTLTVAETHEEITQHNGARTDRLLAVLRKLPGVRFDQRPRRLYYQAAEQPIAQR